MPEPDYSTVTDDEFDRALKEVLDELPASNLLSIAGIYELVAEHFNDAVLDRAIANRKQGDEGQ